MKWQCYGGQDIGTQWLNKQFGSISHFARGDDHNKQSLSQPHMSQLPSSNNNAKYWYSFYLYQKDVLEFHQESVKNKKKIS